MISFPEIGTAVLLVILTLWLQCAGLAAIIVWVRRAVVGDLHRLGPLRSAALVVRITAAIIGLHGVLILLWAGCYRWLCFPSWESALFLGQQLCHGGLWRRSAAVELADVGAVGEHHRCIDVRNIRERSLYYGHPPSGPRGPILGQIDLDPGCRHCSK
jgi:hypothetical protein